MLNYLHVKNIALIDEVEIDFHEGLNIMTGETGAGKSIIIGSINAVLGGKVNKDFVGNNGDEATITLIFQTATQEVKGLLEALGIPFDGEVIISRKMTKSGRSVFRVNGEILNQNNVKELTDIIIDVHSQHEHQSLLNKKHHILLLDRFLGEEAQNILSKLEVAYKSLQDYKHSIDVNLLDDEKRKRELAFLAFEINELELAKLTPGEDVILEEKYRFLSHIHKIKEVLGKVDQLILEESSFRQSWDQALRLLQQIRSYDSGADSLVTQLEEIDGLISDFSRELFHYDDLLEVDEETLQEVRERIDLINQLKMKYGDTIEEMIQLLNQKNQEHNHLVHFEEHLKHTKEQIKLYESHCESLAQQLSLTRQKGANVLSLEITKALNELNLKNAQFEVAFTKKSAIHKTGFDEVEFLVSMNAGEVPKPLVKVASGGEVSRIMLAIKSILADCDGIETMIFDEIDSGISGMTAQRVAEKMADLSKVRQIIAITHLPQIAAMGDAHFKIEKTIEENKTITNMRKLNENEEIDELARLLSGAKITEAVFENAKEMKAMAKERNL